MSDGSESSDRKSQALVEALQKQTKSIDRLVVAIGEMTAAMGEMMAEGVDDPDDNSERYLDGSLG